MSETTGYIPDRVGSFKNNAIQYTSNPLDLLASDVVLLLKLARYIPTVIFPIISRHPLDELYLGNFRNIFDVVFLLIQFVIHALFIISLPILFFLPSGIFPAGSWLMYVVVFLVANYYVCKLFNGSKPRYDSNPDLMKGRTQHDDEKWIFLNGIAVGSHWLQANIDQLSIVFGRPVTGFHNPSAGIVFDLIQCIIQRDFGYVTEDIRNAYFHVKESLYADNPATGKPYQKVIFIVHSQGAIEGGLLLDWLLADMPQQMLRKIEVYSFGNAANHFNNPKRFTPKQASSPRPKDHPGRAKSWAGNNPDKDDPDADKPTDEDPDNGKAMAHVEHYANAGDFVAQWGVLHFANPTAPPMQNLANTFAGRVFERPGNGHLLNQHYLDTMFTLDPATGRVADGNAFMDMPLQVVPAGGSVDEATGTPSSKARKHSARMSVSESSGASGALKIEFVKLRGDVADGVGRGLGRLDALGTHQQVLNGALAEEPEQVARLFNSSDSPVEGRGGASGLDGRMAGRVLKVKDRSRLWRYRNGMVPSD